MIPIYLWVICYLFPVFLVLFIGVIFRLKNRKQQIITHLGLILSILLSQYFIFQSKTSFPFRFSLVSSSLLIMAIIISYLLIGKISVLYSISAVLQQLTMLSMTFLLLPYFKLYEILILIIPIYAVSHLREPKYAIAKLFVTMAFGVISILLFVLLRDIYYLIALHILGGTLLLKNGIIYPRIKTEK